MRATPTSPDLEIARRARRGLAIYFAIVLALSAVIQAVILGRPDLDGLIAGLMLMPALASVVARLALMEGFSDVSFRLGGTGQRRPSRSRSSFPYS